MLDMTPWLLAMALMLLLAEVLERRTGLISLRGFKRLRVRRMGDASEPIVVREKSKRRLVPSWKLAGKTRAPASPVRTPAEPVATIEHAEKGLDDALVRARRQASVRTKPRGSGPRQEN
jgi:hypothetical protein